VNALFSLQVGALASYAIAVLVPALDAIFPVLPSETAIIALGVATAGSNDPRIALLVACSAAGAFLGDNLSYFLGRRFGPRVKRRFFRGEKGARRRAWAERSLERFGMQLIVVCRFLPGGRTAVTLCCGIIGYDRRRFVIATAVAGPVWALYSFFVGRLGGTVFEDTPWAGFAVAFGTTVAVSGLIEAIRRIRSRRARAVARDSALTPWSGRSHTGQVEADDPGEDQSDRDQLRRGHRIAEEDHAPYRGSGGADPRPHRIRGTNLEPAQRHGQQPETQQRAHGEADGRPEPRHTVAQLQRHREAGLEQPGRQDDRPYHRVTSRLPVMSLGSERARRADVPVMEPGMKDRVRTGAWPSHESHTIHNAPPPWRTELGQCGPRCAHLRGAPAAPVRPGRLKTGGPGRRLRLGSTRASAVSMMERRWRTARSSHGHHGAGTPFAFGSALIGA
jgi:membrane-associated protein